MIRTLILPHALTLFALMFAASAAQAQYVQTFQQNPTTNSCAQAVTVNFQNGHPAPVTLNPNQPAVVLTGPAISATYNQVVIPAEHTLVLSQGYRCVYSNCNAAGGHGALELNCVP